MDLEPRDDGTGWLLVLVPLGAWAILDAIRWAQGRPTRSAVAETALRRALAVEVPA